MSATDASRPAWAQAVEVHEPGTTDEYTEFSATVAELPIGTTLEEQDPDPVVVRLREWTEDDDLRGPRVALEIATDMFDTRLFTPAEARAFAAALNVAADTIEEAQR